MLFRSAPRYSGPAISALVSTFGSDLISLLKSAFRSRTTLVAENLFLRKQLVFYREHKIRPQPLTDAARLSLVLIPALGADCAAHATAKPSFLMVPGVSGFSLPL